MMSKTSLAMRQYAMIIAERTAGLSAEAAAKEREALLDNPALQNYYSEPDTIAVTLDGEIVETLPCERVAFEYPCKDEDDPSQWQPSVRGQINLARTQNGDIWAFTDTGPIFHSEDLGKSWQWTPGSSNTSSKDFTFTILQDDTFLVMGSTEGSRSLEVHRSTNLGETWERIATIDPPPPYVVIGDDTPATTQLSDGTILSTVQCAQNAEWSEGQGVLIYRSTDGGKTWAVRNIVWEANRVTPDGPEFPAFGPESDRPEMIAGESHILELPGGSLLQTIRVQGLHHGPTWENVTKTACFLDSADGGLTWQNARPALDAEGKPVLVYGECHGQSTRLPDGRIVMVHDHRYPYPEGQTIAHISEDNGNTWKRHAYHLILGSGYPAILSLEDGTILTVSGSGLTDEKATPLASRKLWTCVAVRWKLPV